MGSLSSLLGGLYLSEYSSVTARLSYRLSFTEHTKLVGFVNFVQYVPRIQTVERIIALYPILRERRNPISK